MSESSPSAVVVDGETCFNVLGMYVFQMGETFSSFEQLEQRLKQHSEVDFVHYWRRDTRTVKGALMKTTRPISGRLKYYSMRYACVHGGQKFSRRGHGHRSKQTMRSDCPSYIMLRATKCGQKLEVIGVCNQHNHVISETESRALPQTRRLSQDVRREVVQMLLLHIDRKKIMEYVRRKTGKLITSKDLLNLRASYEKSKENGGYQAKLEDNCETRDEMLERIRLQCAESEDSNQGNQISAEQYEMEHIDEHGQDDNELIIGSAPNLLSEEMYYEISEDNILVYDELCPKDVETPDDMQSQIHEEGVHQDVEYLNAPYIDESVPECEQLLNIHIVPDDQKSDKIDDYSIKPVLTEALVDYDKIPIEENFAEPAINSSKTHIKKTITMRSRIKPTHHRLPIDRWKTSSKLSRKNTCQHCGLNARLVRVQIAVLEAQKQKLIEETTILRLTKEKLIAEKSFATIEDIDV